VGGDCRLCREARNDVGDLMSLKDLINRPDVRYIGLQPAMAYIQVAGVAGVDDEVVVEGVRKAAAPVMEELGFVQAQVWRDQEGRMLSLSFWRDRV